MSQIILHLRSNNNYAILLTTIFMILGAMSAYHHEMWRDEIQAWLIARDSSSIIDLLRNLKYEGHPGLWHICLMPLTRVTRSPVIMQILHLMIASAVIYIFSRFSPFHKLQKALFAFGYFTFYEHSVICRNYALGILLLFVFCALFEKRFTKLPLAAVVLLLLAHTSVHCLIITIAIGAGLFTESLFKWKRIAVTSTKKLEILAGFLIIALGIATSVIQLKPPADAGFAMQWTTKYDSTRLRDVFNIIERAFVPIPRFNLHFWNTNILDSMELTLSSKEVKSVIAGLIVLWAILLLLGKPVSLLIYILGTTGLLAFFYTKYFGSMRHHAFLFILFIASAWISFYCDDVKLLSKLSFIFRRYMNIPLLLILLVQLVGGAAATGMDYLYTFSQAKVVVHHIRESGMGNTPMVGEMDYAVSTIAGYLGNKIHYVRGDRLGSFVIWDKKRTENVTPENILQKARGLADAEKQDVLIILNFSLNKEIMSQYSLTDPVKFVDAVVGDEVYYLYLMKAM